MAHNILPYQFEPEADIDTNVNWLSSSDEEESGKESGSEGCATASGKKWFGLCLLCLHSLRTVLKWVTPFFVTSLPPVLLFQRYEHCVRCHVCVFFSLPKGSSYCILVGKTTELIVFRANTVTLTVTVNE